MFFNRLDKYLKFKDLNDNKITIEAGISNGLIGKARKRGSLSQENISKILLKYSDLDANWLLTGKGEMLKTDSAPPQTNNDSYKELAEARKEIILLKDEKIHRLEKEISGLKKEIEELHLRRSTP